MKRNETKGHYEFKNIMIAHMHKIGLLKACQLVKHLTVDKILPVLEDARLETQEKP